MPDPLPDPLPDPSTAPSTAPSTDLSNARASASTGTLYGLGVGPGDPELITVKSLRYLQAAPVVAFPQGINGQRGVAERIIEPWLRPEQTKLPLVFPYVTDEQQLLDAWQQAAQRVWPYLQQGDVAFACEGDVSFYGTFTYLAQQVQAQHPEVRVCATAGISSPMAAAAALGIPLTCQAEKLAILPALYSFSEHKNGQESGQDSEHKSQHKKKASDSQTKADISASNALEAALQWADVIVLMKVGRVYPQVWQILARHQLLSQSYVIQNATHPNAKTYRGLQNYPDLQLPYFSLLIVRKLSHCHEQ